MTPGHPVASGAGYDCACGECRFRRTWIETGFTPDQAAAWVAAAPDRPAPEVVEPGVGIWR